MSQSRARRGHSLHVAWASDGSRSGGSIAAMRTVDALRAIGEDARVAVQAGLGPCDMQLPTTGLADRVLYRIAYPLGLHDVHLASSLRVVRNATWSDASVIHLHVIHSGVLNYAALPIICRGKKVVITLHDMWAFTGNCIYSYDCERWRTGCGRCPYPDRHPAMRRDGSRASWLAKRLVWPQLDLQVVAPSRWLAKLASQSMLAGVPVHHVPYPVDTDAFRPRDGAAARARLGIGQDRFVVLFSAHQMRDPRKGADVVPKALIALPDELRRRLTLLTFGDSPLELPPSSGVQSVHLGYLSRDEDKADAFSAADVFAFPSRADNLPLIVQEAVACGTPVLASDVGGIPDLVRPGITGDLFAVDDVAGLRGALEAWAADPDKRRAASRACRAVAEAEWRYDLVADRLARIYARSSAQEAGALEHG